MRIATCFWTMMIADILRYLCSCIWFYEGFYEEIKIHTPACHFDFWNLRKLNREETGPGEKNKKCKWTKFTGWNIPNGYGRTTFSNKPLIPENFWLGRRNMLVPFIFHMESPEFHVNGNNHGFRLFLLFCRILFKHSKLFSHLSAMLVWLGEVECYSRHVYLTLLSFTSVWVVSLNSWSVSVAS